MSVVDRVAVEDALRGASAAAHGIPHHLAVPSEGTVFGHRSSSTSALTSRSRWRSKRIPKITRPVWVWRSCSLWV